MNEVLKRRQRFWQVAQRFLQGYDICAEIFLGEEEKEVHCS